jgi:hypothetical protein
MSFLSAIGDELRNVFSLIFSPNKFFEDVETKSLGYMLKYLFFAAVPFVLGYFLNLYVKAGFPVTEFKCSEMAALESSLITALSLVLVVPTVSMALSMVSKGLFERRVSPSEICTLIGYPMAVVLLSGILRAHVYTVFLHYAGVGYALYVMYTGLSVKYGFDKALMNFIVFLIAIVLVLMVIAGAVLSTFTILLAVANMTDLTSIIPIVSIPGYCY